MGAGVSGALWVGDMLHIWGGHGLKDAVLMASNRALVTIIS